MAKYKMQVRRGDTLPTYEPMDSNAETPELDEEESLVKDAKENPLEFGNKVAGTISATLLPSVYGMLHNSYSVIDTEIRRLARMAKHAGLDKAGTQQFEKYTAALVRLVNMHHTVRDNSQLEALPDSKLLEHARAVLEKKEKK
jgi:hypothetical protein